jgi:hypothetical protein
MKGLYIRESFVDKDGNEKVVWNKLGVLIETKDKQYVKLYHIPNVMVHVFEQKANEDKTAKSKENSSWDG